MNKNRALKEDGRKRELHRPFFVKGNYKMQQPKSTEGNKYLIRLIAIANPNKTLLEIFQAFHSSIYQNPLESNPQMQDPKKQNGKLNLLLIYMIKLYFVYGKYLASTDKKQMIQDIVGQVQKGDTKKKKITQLIQEISKQFDNYLPASSPLESIKHLRMQQFPNATKEDKQRLQKLYELYIPQKLKQYQHFNRQLYFFQMVQTLQDVQFVRRSVKKRNLERICNLLSKYNKSEVYQEKGNKNYEKVVISRYTEEEDEILLNLPDLIQLRKNINFENDDKFTIAKQLLKELSTMKKLSGQFYHLLEPYSVIFNQLNLRICLSYENWIYNALGLSKTPLTPEVRVTCGITPRITSLFQSKIEQQKPQYFHCLVQQFNIKSQPYEQRNEKIQTQFKLCREQSLCWRFWQCFYFIMKGQEHFNAKVRQKQNDYSNGKATKKYLQIWYEKAFQAPKEVMKNLDQNQSSNEIVQQSSRDQQKYPIQVNSAKLKQATRNIELQKNTLNMNTKTENLGLLFLQQFFKIDDDPDQIINSMKYSKTIYYIRYRAEYTKRLIIILSTPPPPLVIQNIKVYFGMFFVSAIEEFQKMRLLIESLQKDPMSTLQAYEKQKIFQIKIQNNLDDSKMKLAIDKCFENSDSYTNRSTSDPSNKYLNGDGKQYGQLMKTIYSQYKEILEDIRKLIDAYKEENEKVKVATAQNFSAVKSKISVKIDEATKTFQKLIYRVILDPTKKKYRENKNSNYKLDSIIQVIDVLTKTLSRLTPQNIYKIQSLIRPIINYYDKIDKNKQLSEQLKKQINKFSEMSQWTLECLSELFEVKSYKQANQINLDSLIEQMQDQSFQLFYQENIQLMKKEPTLFSDVQNQLGYKQFLTSQSLQQQIESFQKQLHLQSELEKKKIEQLCKFQ